MNAPYDIERDLTRWMADVVPTRAPDNLAPEIVARTRSLRPHPAWLARLKEPPMQTHLSLRNYLGFGRSLRPILVAVLILALLAGAVVVGSRLLQQRSLPPPFGVAVNGTLAFDVGGEIVLAEPDGSSKRPLDIPFLGMTGTTFSRDGTRIATWATPDPGRGSQKSLIVANADGSGAFEVDRSRLIGDPGYRIAWSPDNRRLAFSGSMDQLYVADIDGRTIQQVVPDASIEYRKDPAWAPDGRLAYRCVRSDRVLHLCVLSADAQQEQVLQTSPGTDWGLHAPSWSHDGKSLAYQIDDAIDQPASSPGYDVAILDIVTETERVLTRGYAPHTILPVWTPDDRHVLFNTEPGPGVVDVSGADLRILGERVCDWIEPSPDGLLATCLLGDQVHLYPIAGGPPTVIELGGAATFVSWQRLST